MAAVARSRGERDQEWERGKCSERELDLEAIDVKLAHVDEFRSAVASWIRNERERTNSSCRLWRRQHTRLREPPKDERQSTLWFGDRATNVGSLADGNEGGGRGGEGGREAGVTPEEAPHLRHAQNVFK